MSVGSNFITLTIGFCRIFLSVRAAFTSKRSGECFPNSCRSSPKPSLTLSRIIARSKRELLKVERRVEVAGRVEHRPAFDHDVRVADIADRDGDPAVAEFEIDVAG